MEAVLFGNNRTKLSDIDFIDTPAAKGVNASTGLLEALIESAEQDFKLFEAMLKVDTTEIKLKSTGVVSESTIAALHEGALEKVKQAIITGIKWLVSKLRAAKDAIVKAIKQRLDTDYRMLAKYEKKIIENADKLKDVSVETTDVFGFFSRFPHPFEMGEAISNYKDDIDDAIKLYAKQSNNVIDKLIIARIDYGDNVEFKKYTGTMSYDTPANAISAFKDYKSQIENFDKKYTTWLRQLDQLQASIDKNSVFKEEDSKKIIEMFAAYKKYAITYTEISRELLVDDLNNMRKLIKAYIAKLNNVNEAMLAFIIESEEAEFQDELRNTYGDEDTKTPPAAPEANEVIAATADPAETFVDAEELQVENFVLY